MSRHPTLTLPPVTCLSTPCPNCQGDLTVYVFMQATDWANTSKGLELTVNTTYQIGPHACYPSALPEDIMADGADALIIAEAWGATP